MIRALSLLAFAACAAPSTTPPDEDPPIVEPSAACRARAMLEYVVEITGTFADHDGVELYATTAIELVDLGGEATATSCQTTRATTITEGRAAVTLANLTDTAVYPFIGAFLDLDGDGRCSSLDPSWGIYGVITEVGVPDRIMLDASMFRLDDPLDVCAHFTSIDR